MTDTFSLDQIRSFWTERAVQLGESPSASWSDHPVIEMEIEQILRYLEPGQRILDVGCANGFSSASFAAGRDIRVVGVDYIPEMIEAANSRRAALPAAIRDRLEFAVGDATALDFPDDSFDVVVVVRVIINLADWENQLRGMSECARVLRPGGLLLMSEATIQGWQRLNAFRAEWGLDPIPMPPFNRYLDEERVAEALAPGMQLEEVVNFASTYYVGTRVIKPLLARAAGAGVDVARADSEWNRWFSKLPAGGDYGTQKLFVFRKA